MTVKVQVHNLPTLGVILVVAVPLGLCGAFAAIAPYTEHKIVFFALSLIFSVVPAVGMILTDDSCLAEAERFIHGCPICGAKCTQIDVNYIPLGKSRVTYECMTEIVVRRKKHAVHRSVMCGIEAIGDDTI